MSMLTDGTLTCQQVTTLCSVQHSTIEESWECAECQAEAKHLDEGYANLNSMNQEK